VGSKADNSVVGTAGKTGAVDTDTDTDFDTDFDFDIGY
jgi:hypothetical protein